MKKAIMFSCLLAGFTACTLDTLTQEVFLSGIQETSGIGNVSTNIVITTTNTVTNITTNTTTNLIPDTTPDTGTGTVTVLSTNTAEVANRAILTTFGINTAGLIQYNTNEASGSVVATSYNIYVDNETNPTKVVRVSTVLNHSLSTSEKVMSQLVAEYTATKLPDNTYNSFVLNNIGGSSATPSGGVFLRLVPRIYKLRSHNGSVLSAWLDDTRTTEIWIKISGNTARFSEGSANPSNPSQFIFYAHPDSTGIHTRQ